MPDQTLRQAVERMLRDEEAWIRHGWDWTFQEYLDYRDGRWGFPLPPPESDNPG